MIKKIPTILFYVFAGFLVIYVYVDPIYNGDLIYYAGKAKGINRENLAEVHKEVFEELKSLVPPHKYSAIVNDKTLYQASIDPDAYYRVMPYHAVKPLYTFQIRAIHGAGLNVVKSSIIPTCLAIGCLSILVFNWIKLYVPDFYALLLSMILLACGSVVPAVSIFSPDALAAFFLVFFFYLYVEKQRILLSVLSLIACILTRIDFIIPAFLGISFMLLKKELKFLHYLGLLSLFVLIYFTITMAVRDFGWHPVFFTGYYSSEYHIDFANTAESVNNYFKVLINAAENIIYFTGMIYFLLIGMMGFTLLHLNDNKNKSYYSGIYLLLLVCIFLKILIFPYLEDRFYTGFYIVLAIMTIKMFRVSQSVKKAGLA